MHILIFPPKIQTCSNCRQIVNINHIDFLPKKHVIMCSKLGDFSGIFTNTVAILAKKIEEIGEF